MNITKTITKDGQNFVVLTNAAGEDVAMNLGCAIAAAAGDDDQASNVIRTTKYLAEIKARRIDEDEANEAIAAVVATINEKAAALIAEYETAKPSELDGIEKQIAAAII